MLTHEEEDRIYNALVVGMTIHDAYIYAGLSPAQITEADEDTELQRKLSMMNKELEFRLLSRLDAIAAKQAKMGKEGATTWMLEKMFPRYSAKPQTEMPVINLHVGNSSEDDAEIH